MANQGISELFGTLWANKTTGKIVRVTSEQPYGAHKYVTIRGNRSYEVAASNLPKKYTQVDDEWLVHADAGTTVPDLDYTFWTKDDVGYWYTPGDDNGRSTVDLNLWALR